MRKLYADSSARMSAREAANIVTSRKAAASGMVLLENENVLPLAKGSRVALYGYGARHTVYCGYGAASTASRQYISIEQGLKDKGIVITTADYLTRYEEAILSEEEEYFSGIRAKIPVSEILNRIVYMYGHPFTPKCQLRITEADDSSPRPDTAVFVISRVAGEGRDRRNEPGDYLLSEAEKENLTWISRHYSRLVLILNTCGVIDTAFLRHLPVKKAILFAGMNGGTTGGSAADLIVGDMTPEGRLASTWAENYSDYPSADTYGACNGNLDDEYYTEGIYTGYRWFDSCGIRPAYEFGFGMSYTTFSRKIVGVRLQEDCLELDVRVKNTGSRWAGRETIQVYVSCPEKELRQPAQKLAGFQKSASLGPGEEETLTISIAIPSLASYSEKSGAWILEPGDYIVRAGSSSRDTQPAAILRVEKKAVITQCRNLFKNAEDQFPVELVPDRKRSIYAAEKPDDSLPVLDWTFTGKTEVIRYRSRQEAEEKLTDDCIGSDAGDTKFRFSQLLAGQCTAEEMAASLSLSEMALLCVGNVPGLSADGNNKERTGGNVVAETTETGDDVRGDLPLTVIPGASDTTRSLIESRGIPNMNVCDGGTGLRLVPFFHSDRHLMLNPRELTSVKNMDRLLAEIFAIPLPPEKTELSWYQYTTPLPMASILASAWDPEIWEQCGEIEGSEMEHFGVKIWLGPSMNIHRNPLCGRNFEYYSEDPLLTGACAAQVAGGIQRYSGAGVCIKHFACNNQEDNRGAVNVHVSERALREIYLKGFETVVSTCRPAAIMTALNLVNGTHAANIRDLLTDVAREEWGFDGLVMTDWGTTSGEKGANLYGPSDAAECLHAGNDLIMPGDAADVRALLQAVQSGRLKMEEVRWCAANILRVMKKLYQTDKQILSKTV